MGTDLTIVVQAHASTNPGAALIGKCGCKSCHALKKTVGPSFATGITSVLFSVNPTKIEEGFRFI